MSAHTPTPWTFEPPAKDSDWQGAIKGPGGVEVCSFGDSTQYYPTEGCPPDEDDAEFLIRAVNAHDDLLTACKLTEEAAQHSMECDACATFFAGLGDRCSKMTDLTKRGIELRLAAIAKAEGQ